MHPGPLVPVADHLADLLRRAMPLAAHEVPLASALGLVLADEVRTRHALPPYDASAMDGFAVRAADTTEASTETPVELVVAASAPAGLPTEHHLTAGEAVRIFTGGVIPAGADAVVPVEQTVSSADGRVRLSAPVDVGAYVRSAGEELPAGAAVAPAGRVLDPGAIAAVAAAGHGSVRVVRRPRVAVVSTGDELRDPGADLAPGQLPDSNAVSVAAAAVDAGAEVIRTTRSSDDAAAFRELLREVAADADVVITTGGVSAGAERDVVKHALEASGDVSFVRVAMQPGMPQAVGSVDGALLLGLPGNPVSALVSMAVFVRPVLRALAGRPAVLPSPEVALGSPVEPLPGKTRFVRARLVPGVDQPSVAFPVGGHGSHLVAALAATEVLLEVPPGTAELPVGTLVGTVRWFGPLEEGRS